MKSDGAETVRSALRHAGIHVLENKSVPVSKDGRTIWIAGLADQLAERLAPREFRGYDDIKGTLAQASSDAPVILLAHEPNIFSQVPKRVTLTLCGHTHGGQVNLPLVAGFSRARLGTKYLYGHIVEDGRHMIISGGLGTSKAPIRFLRPPEIVTVTIEQDHIGLV